MATYYTLLTKIGQARIANAVALNQMVNLTYMAVGDGNGNPTTPNENQTALVREKYRATINQLTVDPDNPNYLVAELIVPTTVGGWSIYEVGVFDDQNQLIAVANFPATYKPELAEGSGRDLIVRIVIQVSNTSVVTLKIDPAITLASQAWVAANYVKKITVSGGTTGQILAKKSNANEDFQWVDPTAAVDVNVFSREETQTVASGQTIVNLAQLTTDGAAIYIEGVRLRDDQFIVNSATRLTLATSYPAGTKVTIVQNEETSRNAFMLKANNLSDLADKEAARKNLSVDGFTVVDPNESWMHPVSDKSTHLFITGSGVWGAYNGQNISPLGIPFGGTGAGTKTEARANLGLGSVSTEDTVPVSKGGTGAQDAVKARENLGLDRVEQRTGETVLFSDESKTKYLTSRTDNSWGYYNSTLNRFIPLPVESGGTGVASIGELKTSLGLKSGAYGEVRVGVVSGAGEKSFSTPFPQGQVLGIAFCPITSTEYMYSTSLSFVNGSGFGFKPVYIAGGGGNIQVAGGEIFYYIAWGL